MEGKRNPWHRLLAALFPYWIGCCTLGATIAMVFDFPGSDKYSPNWKQVVATILTLAIYSALPSFKRLHRFVIPITSLALTTLFVIWSVCNLAVRGSFCYSSITLWLFGIGAVTMLELMSIEPPKLRDPRWIRTAFAGLFFLLIFAGAYYPNLRSSWGGRSSGTGNHILHQRLNSSARFNCPCISFGRGRLGTLHKR